jgi:Zn-dependent M28 family amino/carboxypeptidase
MRILATSGVKPQRTIRVVLWSGEEQGELGSEGYVRDHAAELDKISTVIVDDEGTGFDAGYNCTDNMKDVLQAAIDPVVKAFPDMPEKINVMPRFRQEQGSDHDSYIAKGVPGLFTVEGGNVDYGFIWHTQNDRFETAVPKFLVQSATNKAAVLVYIADAPELLPRVSR